MNIFKQYFDATSLHKEIAEVEAGRTLPHIHRHHSGPRCGGEIKRQSIGDRSAYQSKHQR